MPLGRLLGEGRTADVYEYGEGRAVKLLRPGLDPEIVREEAEMTRIAARAGAPAPRVHELVSVDGRPGIVVSHVSGESLLDLIREDPERPSRWAELLARAHARVLELEVNEMRDVRDTLRARITDAPELSDRQRHLVLGVLDSLHGGDRLLHGDFHPSNVFVSGDNATIIDWGNSAQGPPAADVARTLHLVSPDAIPPGFPDRDQIMRSVGRFRESYLETVLGLVQISEDDLDRWTLPVLAGRLSEGIEWERVPIMCRIESLIG